MLGPQSATAVVRLRRSAAALLLFLAAGAAGAQEPETRSAANAVYVELLGNGLLYSVNYDRLLEPDVAVRVGIMLLGAAEGESSAGVIAAPIMASYLLGEGSGRFEAGLGVSLMSGAVENVEEVEDESFSGAVATATLGYRYQRPGGGFVFRAGLTPFISTSGVLPWFGLSFGYGF